MQRLCPIHGTALEASGKLWYCAGCRANYRTSGSCADCGEELERLAACGATNWWCNRCNELKSKSRVKTEMVKV